MGVMLKLYFDYCVMFVMMSVATQKINPFLKQPCLSSGGGGGGEGMGRVGSGRADGAA